MTSAPHMFLVTHEFCRKNISKNLTTTILFLILETNRYYFRAFKENKLSTMIITKLGEKPFVHFI